MKFYGKFKNRRFLNRVTNGTIYVAILIIIICYINLAEAVVGSTFPAKQSNLSHESIKLRICEKNRVRIPQDYIELPVLSLTTFNFTLQKFAVAGGDFFLCFNEARPIPLLESIAVNIPEYDEAYRESNYSPDFKDEIMRTFTFLLASGYLSVGIDQVAHYYSPDEYCIESLHGEGRNTVMTFKTCPATPGRPILPKCCPYGMVLGAKSCFASHLGENWDPKYLDSKTLKAVPILEAYPMYTSPLVACEGAEVWDFDSCSNEFHPVTDNRVAFVGASRKWEFFSLNTTVCLDMQVKDGEPDKMILVHCAVGQNQDNSTKARISLIYMISMYIGAFFHLLTTVVYLVTWSKQNIHGMTLSSCTTSLFFMQIFLGTVHLFGIYEKLRNYTLCVVNGILGQYFMIAAFTWLLVVNIDLWQTFRTLRPDGNKNSKRFILHSFWGWGIPLIITAISVCLEFTFKCRATRVPVPEYGEHFCFVSPWTQGFYVYYILAVLISLSCIFAVLTLFGVYSFKKNTGNLRTSRNADDKQTIILFLKLGVVMGFTWIFEVISWAATEEGESNMMIWIILDMYNTLSAILIFFIFVCKRSMLSLLEQSVPMLKALSKFAGESTSDHTANTIVNGDENNANGRAINQSTDSPTVHFTKRPAKGNSNDAYQ